MFEESIPGTNCSVAASIVVIKFG